MWVNAVLIILFGLLQVVDGFTTWYGLSNGLVDEASPLAAAIFSAVGTGTAVAVVKLAVLAFAAWMFTHRKRMKGWDFTVMLALCTAVYLYVSINNFLLVVK